MRATAAVLCSFGPAVDLMMIIADTLVEAAHRNEDERTHSLDNLLCRHVREQRVARHPARIVHPAGEACPRESFFMWLCLVRKHLTRIAEPVQHLCPHRRECGERACQLTRSYPQR